MSLSKADKIRLHRYGLPVGTFLNKWGIPVHSVTCEPHSHAYYVHTNRRMIAKFDSFDEMADWAAILGLKWLRR